MLNTPNRTIDVKSFWNQRLLLLLLLFVFDHMPKGTIVFIGFHVFNIHQTLHS